VNYSNALRSIMIQKMTGSRPLSANALSREAGIPQSTLSRWLRDAARIPRSHAARNMKGKGEILIAKRPADWSPEEKFNLVIEASSMPESELGAFLRSTPPKSIPISASPTLKRSTPAATPARRTRNRTSPHLFLRSGDVVTLTLPPGTRIPFTLNRDETFTKQDHAELPGGRRHLR
jgi:hypothetical protein